MQHQTKGTAMEPTGKYPRDAIAQKKRHYLDAFFAMKSIREDDLLALVNRSYPDPQHILYVSTAINGLGGTTSDMDIIVIERERAGLPDISSMLFLTDQRVGLKVYSSDQMEKSLQSLGELDSNHTIGQALAQFDGTFIGMSIIDLERCINALSATGEVPYLNHMDAIAHLWFWREFARFREATLLALLAERSGEQRAPLGYAVVGIQALMNAIMSLACNVNSSRKWTLERWRRLREVDSMVFYDEADTLWKKIFSGIKAQSDVLFGTELLQRYHQLSDRLHLTITDDAAVIKGLNPGGWQLVNGVRAIRKTDNTIALNTLADDFDATITLADVAKLPQGEAAGILSLARAGELTFELRDTEKSRLPLSTSGMCV